MGWIDTLLNIGSMADWISPAVQMAEDRLGGMEALTVKFPPGYTGPQIRRYLKRHGVQMGATPMLRGRWLVATVSDAERARRLLERL